MKNSLDPHAPQAVSRHGEDKARRMFIERQPMGRLGTAEEMAHIAVYLASDESVYTTGSAMLSDGGFTL